MFIALFYRHICHNASIIFIMTEKIWLKNDKWMLAVKDLYVFYYYYYYELNCNSLIILLFKVIAHKLRLYFSMYVNTHRTYCMQVIRSCLFWFWQKLWKYVNKSLQRKRIFNKFQSQQFYWMRCEWTTSIKENFRNLHIIYFVTYIHTSHIFTILVLAFTHENSWVPNTSEMVSKNCASSCIHF